MKWNPYNDRPGNANKLALAEREVGAASFDSNIQLLRDDLIDLEVRIVGERRIVLLNIRLGIVIRVVAAGCRRVGTGGILRFLFLFELLLKNQSQLIPDLDFLEHFSDFSVRMLHERVDVRANRSWKQQWILGDDRHFLSQFMQSNLADVLSV